MKWKLAPSLFAILVSLVAALAFPAVSRADGPMPDVQPWMYAAAEYSGLGNVAAVQAAFKNYQDNQALVHQYTAPAQWHDNYANDVTNWLRAHGCASCYLSDDALSFNLKIDVPVAEMDFGIFGANGPH